MSTYVDFVRQGFPTLEPTTIVEETKEVFSRDTTGLQIPKGCFGFYFYDVIGKSKPTNVSPWHYVGGKVFEVDGKRTLEFRGDVVTSTFVLEDAAVLIPA